MTLLINCSFFKRVIIIPIILTIFNNVITYYSHCVHPSTLEVLLIASTLLVWGLRIPLLEYRGLQWINPCGCLSSVYLTICPAHCHLLLVIRFYNINESNTCFPSSLSNCYFFCTCFCYNQTFPTHIQECLRVQTLYLYYSYFL